MPWHRPSKHDAFNDCCNRFLDRGVDIKVSPAKASGRKSRSVSCAVAFVMHMGMTPATAWLHASSAATSISRPAVPRASWTTAYSSSLFQQKQSQLETGVRREDVLMFGTTLAGDGPQEKEEPIWLGLDLSTQSLTAAVLQGDGVGADFNEPVVLESINYEVCAPRAALCFFRLSHESPLTAVVYKSVPSDCAI